MRAVTIVNPRLSRPPLEEQLRLERADQSPRYSLFELTLNSDILDEKFMQQVRGNRRWLYRFLPLVLSQVIEALIICRKYDVIISWCDPHTLLLSFLFKFLPKPVPLIGFMSWVSKRKKTVILKRVHSKIDRMVLWSSTQRDFVIKELGISPSKVSFVRFYVDQEFWRPMAGAHDMICAAGFEMRDYVTFIEAVRYLDIRTHIAAGVARGELFHTVKAIYNSGPLPQNITVSMMNPLELRTTYARSRFVVVPLLPTKTDNGLTVILESMAMGKAVICSRTEGQIDVIQDGITGMYVPQGDPKALREAIQYLWDNPDVADKMGMEGRKYVEENNTWDRFVETVKGVAEEIVEEYSRTRRR